MKTLRFEKADRQWLDFVTANRTGTPAPNVSDVIVGLIADDRTIETLNLYFSGTITEEIALELLLPQKLKEQLTFKTESALALLRYEETIPL